MQTGRHSTSIEFCLGDVEGWAAASRQPATKHALATMAASMAMLAGTLDGTLAGLSSARNALRRVKFALGHDAESILQVWEEQLWKAIAEAVTLLKEYVAMIMVAGCKNTAKPEFWAVRHTISYPESGSCEMASALRDAVGHIQKALLEDGVGVGEDHDPVTNVARGMRVHPHPHPHPLPVI
ncbi:MAG: hypothetical protein B7Z66_15120 [Chromatiales bacterium 21-64-14]|nr:MAG: hypothetical protein B7Z66_15120 [Chromatiales bacterium 21-64-14]